MTRTRQVVKTKEKERKVYDVTEGLKSTETMNTYKWHFSKFLQHSAVTPANLLTLERRELEELIVSYLKYLDSERKLRPSTISNSLAAIAHFFTMNDVLINRTKINKLCIKAEEDNQEDRAYTRKEIARLLKESDIRFRAIILLMASTGVRVGSINQLRIGDLTPISITDSEGGQNKIYKVMVYSRSKRGRYYCFCTNEAALAIDEYLKFRRKKAHEDITKADSPLFREQFSLYNRRREGMLDISIPRKITQGVIEQTILRIVDRANLDASANNIMLTHGLRKRVATKMRKAGVDFTTREFLLGHRHGLDKHYDRTTEEERLVEWSKAIGALTISGEYHAEAKLEFIEGKQQKEISELKAENAKLRTAQTADKAILLDQINRIRKEFLDREDKQVHTMVKAGWKYDKVQEELEHYKKIVKKAGLSESIS